MKLVFYCFTIVSIMKINNKVGYIKAVTKGFDYESQREVLREAGCVVIYRDIVSSNKTREGFKELLNNVSSGDTVVVHSLDRLGASMTQLLDTLDLFRRKEIALVSIMESIDSEKKFSLTDWVKLMKKNVEKMNLERTEPARMGAVSRGRQGGRPEKITKQQEKSIKKLYFEKNMTIRKICEKFNISRPTVYKYLK